MTSGNGIGSIGSLDETIKGTPIPLASSTGIKDRNKQMSRDKCCWNFADSFNYDYLKNNNNRDEEKFPQISGKIDQMNNGIDSVYLVASEVPRVQRERFCLDNSGWRLSGDRPNEQKERRCEKKLDLSITPITQTTLTTDEDKTDTVGDSQEDLYTLNSTAFDRCLMEHDSCDITKLAYAVATATNEVNRRKYELNRSINKKGDSNATTRETPEVPFTSGISNNPHGDKVAVGMISGKQPLLSNKTMIAWIGVPVAHNTESKEKYEHIIDWLHFNKIIKSFKLQLNIPEPTDIQLSLHQTNDVFHFCSQSGTDFHQTKNASLEPHTDCKFYVMFHPNDSAYHHGLILIQLRAKKFKIRLFGYAEPAKIELTGFVLSSTPGVAQGLSEVLVKRCSVSRDIAGLQSISVFNTGARTAYVAFFSFQKSVRFQPRSFLLIPKTSFDVQVTSASYSEENDDSISFFLIYTDEELRRSCRTSHSCLDRNPQYQIFDVLHIFANLPEEKYIKQQELPNHDWRLHLSRQINTSYKTGSIIFKPRLRSRTCLVNQDGDHHSNLRSTDATGVPTVLEDLVSSDSVCTIERRTLASSVTGVSALSNIRNLNSRTVYMNSATASFIQSLNDNILAGVSVLPDVNRFPQTVISHQSHLAILIRNNNNFAIKWIISSPLLMSSNALNNARVTHTPSPSPSASSSRESSSILSLASVPMYNPATTFNIRFTSGSLKPLASVLVPVSFIPLQTGMIECRCSVKLFIASNEMSFEKHIDFSGEGVRKRLVDSCHSQMTPVGFTVCSNVLCFTNVRLGTTSEQRLQIHNTSNHVKDIFFSQLRKPFEIRLTQTSVERGRSLITIYLHSVTSGTFEDVLLLSDDEGNSTCVHLRADVLRKE